MKNLGDMLVSTGPFSEVVIGNQAIVSYEESVLGCNIVSRSPTGNS